MSAVTEIFVEVESEGVILIRGDRIELEPIDWFWDGWIAGGKMHILAGAPGTGKTTLALAMAAAVTIGGEWPDGTAAPSGSVVIWSGEDDPADTLAPRLAAMGAEMTHVHFVEAVVGLDGKPMPFDPARDIEALSTAMAGLPDVRLLIVDPIVSAVASDSHKNSETRRSLQPLVDLAAKHRCALLGITHFSKGTAGREPVERVTGSLAFAALARVVLLAAKQAANGEQPERRLLLRAKSNIGPDSGGYTYELQQIGVPGHPGLTASSVLWGSAVEGNARDLLAEAEQEDASGHNMRAADLLRELLADGPKPATEILAAAGKAGYSDKIMRRAQKDIGAEGRKQGMNGGWVWSLPVPVNIKGSVEALVRNATKKRAAAEDAEDSTHRKAASSASSGGKRGKRGTSSD